MNEKCVEIFEDDREERFYDNDYCFTDNGVITLAEIKRYWNDNYDTDPCLVIYDSFDEWFDDTKQWLDEE